VKKIDFPFEKKDLKGFLVSEPKKEQPVLYYRHTVAILEPRYWKNLIKTGKEKRHVILNVLPKRNTNY
jgi:hypothetical protein